VDDHALRSWFEQRTAEHAFSGSALVWRDGGPVFRYWGGLAQRGHRVPVSDDTRFAVASVTKLPTAIAALRLVEQGRVRLDQPVVELLPADQWPRSLTPLHTLHHLLSQTSGIPNYHDDEDPTWASFLSCWDRVPSYHVRRPADMLPLFAELPAVFLPGERYQYSDANFILVGLILEAATGRAFSDVIVDAVFAPAGMADTAFEALDADPPRLATGYLTNDGPYEVWRSNIFGVTAMGMPDGGMITTPVDLARLVDALVGERLLSSALTAAAISPQGPPSDAIEQYGYGCMLAVADGAVQVVGHGGSDPGVSALVSHYPAAATTTVVLCNQDRGAGAATIEIARAFGLRDPRR
jgi:CubicO group peptidase (beta-lactamase class C family)